MKRLRKKLRSQHGASILMALLMLLICMMVAASVLAAAASNAGKARSNRVEQQKYLTVSSAIQFVADEIEKATYTGKYKLYTWRVTTPINDAHGNVIGTSYEDFFYIEQQQGAFDCGVLGKQEGTTMNSVVPLLYELDEIFNEQFLDDDGYAVSGYGSVSGLSLTSSSDPHTLTVTLPPNITGYPYDTASGPNAYKISDIVTVQVKLDHNTHHITLTAWLGDDSDPPADSSNTMIAELVAKVAEKDEFENLKTDAYGNYICEDGNPLVTVSPPAGATAKTPAAAGAAEKDGTTATMTWQLHWIKKGAA